MIELMILGLVAVFYVAIVAIAVILVGGLILAPFIILFGWEDFGMVWRAFEVFIGIAVLLISALLIWDYKKGYCSDAK